MRELYVCNTSSDCISEVNLDSFKEERKISLKKQGTSKIGPHGIYVYNKKLLVANNYSNSISIIDINSLYEENYFIGIHCNDVVAFEDNAYIICGELNSLIILDLKCKKVVEEIPAENSPHSICINKEKNLLLVSNMESDSITLIDCTNRANVKNIRVGCYPTKAIFSLDNKYIIVCESNIGSDFKGSIAVISVKDFKLINRIVVGNSPVDMYYDGNMCFVSNFGDGTVSMIDLNYYKEIKKVNIGGMPRGIIKVGEHVYVGDNYNNLLIRVHLMNENKKVIPIGGEPTGMALY